MTTAVCFLLGYIPFLRPLPVWQDGGWPWLLLPLCVAVAIVYKSIKAPSMREAPKQAAFITIWILAAMGAAAAVLAGVVRFLER